MSGDVFHWWLFLCTVGGLNLLAWSLSAAALKRRQGVLPSDIYAARRVLLLLSAVYVFGCAFRCALPVYDIPRLCLVDSWLSSVIVGRSVATLAELCFVAQWALLLREFSRATDSRFGDIASRVIIPLIAIAEICSWYSVLTTSNLGHVVEEAIWGVSALLQVIGLWMLRSHFDARLKPLIVGCCAGGIVYVAFMFLVDVPMYWSRWIADGITGRIYLTISQGILDASTRWLVSHRLADWESEMVWMSLYFSAAVWLSIALIHVPALKHGTRTHQGLSITGPCPRAI